jgi:hypothetical protein
MVAVISLERSDNGQFDVFGANAADVYESELNEDVLEPSSIPRSLLAVRPGRHVKLVLWAEFVTDLVVDLKYGSLVVTHYMEPDPERARDCGS